MNRYEREQAAHVVKDARDMLTGIIPATNDELAAMTAELLDAAERLRGQPGIKHDVVDFVIRKAEAVVDDLRRGRRRHDDLIVPE